MKPARWRWLVLLTIACALLPALHAAEPAPGILFVHLRVKDGVISLISATNVPGVLKARRSSPPPRDYQLVLEDADGKELWADSVADPSNQRLEYGDPARPGEIQVKVVRRPDTEFTVRLPAKVERRHLAIYRQRPAPADAAPARNPPTRELVTRLALPLETKP